VHKVVSIDQSPIGRNSRSNPATYVGFYDDDPRPLHAAPLSIERGYQPGRSASTSRAAAARSARAKA
jgi:excinuclease ABC subunit A